MSTDLDDILWKENSWRIWIWSLAVDSQLFMMSDVFCLMCSVHSSSLQAGKAE